MTVRTLLLLVVLLISLKAFGWWLGQKMAFHPQQQWDFDPVAGASPAEEIYFQSSDGLELSGVWYPREGADGVMVYCHGNAGNLSHRLPVVELWRDRLCYEVLLFDYRGYGKSQGRPNEDGLFLDTVAAYWEARSRSPHVPVLAGRSLGTVPATRVASSLEVRGLVLDSPMASAGAMARKLFAVPGLEWLAGLKFDNVTRVQSITCPVFVMHGERDALIPLEQARQVFQAAPDPKQFLVLEQQGHNDLRNLPEMIEQLERFLSGLETTVRTGKPVQKSHRP